MNWIAIGSITDIPRRGARCVDTPEGKVAVFRTADDRVFAIDDHCPHKGGPLSQGIVHGASVTCPLHNWVISLESGKAQGAELGKQTAAASLGAAVGSAAGGLLFDVAWLPDASFLICGIY